MLPLAMENILMHSTWSQVSALHIFVVSMDHSHNEVVVFETTTAAMECMESMVSMNSMDSMEPIMHGIGSMFFSEFAGLHDCLRSVYSGIC